MMVRLKMKWIGALVAAVLCTMAFSLTALAAEEKKGEISVTGNGIVTVDPDLATMYISIEVTEKTAEEAQKKNATDSAKVVAALKAAGIADEDIKTNYYRVNPRYWYDEKTGERKITGYMASNSLEVATKDVENTGKYLDAAIQAGATGNDGVQFSVKDPTKYYAQALTLALDNANKSATTIANALGGTLGKAISVQENYSGDSYVQMEYKGAMTRGVAEEAAVDNASAEIRYDKIKITANINATYQYE